MCHLCGAVKEIVASHGIGGSETQHQLTCGHFVTASESRAFVAAQVENANAPADVAKPAGKAPKVSAKKGATNG